MSRLVWSQQSLDSIHRLYQFLAEKDTSAAQRAMAAIRGGVSALSHQPNIGRPYARGLMASLPDLLPNQRSELHTNNLIAEELGDGHSILCPGLECDLDMKAWVWPWMELARKRMTR